MSVLLPPEPVVCSGEVGSDDGGVTLVSSKYNCCIFRGCERIESSQTRALFAATSGTETSNGERRESFCKL